MVEQYRNRSGNRVIDFVAGIVSRPLIEWAEAERRDELNRRTQPNSSIPQVKSPNPTG
jgi:hypothetical protein